MEGTLIDIHKFNPYHDRLGRFTGPGGFTSFSANPDTKAGKLAIRRAQKVNPLIGAAFGTKRSPGQIKDEKLRTESRKKATAMAENFGITEGRKEFAQKVADLYSHVNKNGGIRMDSESNKIKIKKETNEKVRSIAMESVNGIKNREEPLPEYTDLKQYVRNTPLKISEYDRHDIADFNDYRKQNFGNFKLSNDGLPVDTFYGELATKFPHLFDAERVTSPSDRLQDITDTLNQLKPKETSLSAEEKEFMAKELSKEIIYNYFGVQQNIRKSNTCFAKSFCEVLLTGNSNTKEVKTAKSFSEIKEINNHAKPPPAATFSQIIKFNPYHDRLGRFATGSGFISSWNGPADRRAVTFSANPETRAGAMAIQRESGKHESIGRAYGGSVSIPDKKPKENRSEKLTQNLKSVEEKNRTRKTEQANIYDKDGNLLFSKGGSKSEVSFSGMECRMMKGSVLTHNHPRGSNFSAEDIRISVHRELHEIRASTPQGTVYSFKPGKVLKSQQSKEEFWDAFQTEERKIDRNVRKDLDPVVLPGLATGKMTLTQANNMARDYRSEKMRDWFNANQSKYGYEYAEE